MNDKLHQDVHGAYEAVPGQAVVFVNLTPHPCCLHPDRNGEGGGGRGVGSLAVLGQTLESQLDPGTPRLRRQVVSHKHQLLISTDKEVGEVVL